MEGFTLTWHQPAYLAGGWWLLYRKMYLWALVGFGGWVLGVALSLLPIGTLIWFEALLYRLLRGSRFVFPDCREIRWLIF